MTKEQALALAAARVRARSRNKITADTEAWQNQIRNDLTGDMSFTDKFNAGMGKAFTDVGRGAAQLVGTGPSAEEVSEQKKLDAPLMSTPSGVAGNVAGNIAMMAPAAVLPGAAAVPAAGALGASVAALQPAESTGERLTNMAVGGGLGAGTQALAGPVARRVGEWAAGREREALATALRNTTRDKTLKEAQAAGYVVPASAVNPSASNKVIESIAGKAAVGQDAALRNQQVTNRLARRAIGLPDDAPLSEETIKGVRKVAGQPYRDVAAISDEAAGALEKLKDARFQANAYSKHYQMSADPKSLQQAKDYQAAADALEKRLEELAAQSGKPVLVEALRGARKQIAKTWDVERALNVGTGDVSAKSLGRALDKGRPLTNELALAGRFAESFGPYAREGAGIPTPNVSKSAALVAALMGGGGGAALGPGGIAAAAVPFIVPPAARNLALSKTYQRLLAKPDYSVGKVTRETAALADPETRRRLALTLRATGFPLIPAATGD